MARFVATVSIVSANGIRMDSAIADARNRANTSDICKCLKVGADSGAEKEEIMSKKKQKVRIYYKDGKTDVVPQKFWDDYEVNGGLFVLKKKGAWIYICNMDTVACIVVDARGK